MLMNKCRGWLGSEVSAHILVLLIVGSIPAGIKSFHFPKGGYVEQKRGGGPSIAIVLLLNMIDEHRALRSAV